MNTVQNPENGQPNPEYQAALDRLDGALGAFMDAHPEYIQYSDGLCRLPVETPHCAPDEYFVITRRAPIGAGDDLDWQTITPQLRNVKIPDPQRLNYTTQFLREGNVLVTKTRENIDGVTAKKPSVIKVVTEPEINWLVEQIGTGIAFDDTNRAPRNKPPKSRLGFVLSYF